MFSCVAHDFFWINIGLPYLAHGYITIRWCVVYIHDPDSMLTFELKDPELVSLAHQFCASFCLHSSKFREKNQIIINLMKHGMCNTHINDYYSKYFV